MSAFVDAEARLNRDLAAFARADAGYSWREQKLDWTAMAGLRWRF